MTTFYSQFAQYYELIFPFREATYNFLKSYAEEESARVLDLGCGSGHYVGRFAREGFNAVGIDLDEQMIAFAQKTYPAARFVRMNLSEISRLEERFDLIFSVGNVVPHLKSEYLKSFIKDVNTVAKDGGYWIVQMINWDYVIRNQGMSFPVIEHPEHKLRFIREYLDVSEECVTFRTVLQQDEKTVFEQKTPLYPITPEKFLEIHRKNGFEPAAQYSDFKKSPFDEAESKSVVFVFRKA
ncbi:MAG: class I SAM-dependent methyltransferase [Calditrichaeota bacterium]|nr:class I SAM-dependent methyltransferase [Calditrichota bacterium]